MSKIDSHFEKFFSAYRSFDQKPPNVIEAPFNPVSVNNTEFKIFTKIENEYTLKWVSLMNIIYSSLLLDIHSSMFYFELSPEDKDRYLRLVFTNMSSLIKLLSQVLFRLPLHAGAYQANAVPVAAPTFETDPEYKTATSKAELNELNNKFLNKIAEAMSLIKADPFYVDHTNNDPEAGSVFYNIQDYHNEKRELLLLVLL